MALIDAREAPPKKRGPYKPRQPREHEFQNRALPGIALRAELDYQGFTREDTGSVSRHGGRPPLKAGWRAGVGTAKVSSSTSFSAMRSPAPLGSIRSR